MAVDPREQEELVTAQRSELLKSEYIDLRGQQPPLVNNILDPKEMRALKVAPLEQTNTHLIFAFTIETNKSTIEKLKTSFQNFVVDTKLVSRSSLEELLNRYDPPIVKEDTNVIVADEGASANFGAVTAEIQEKKPRDVFKFLIKQAYMLRASDIHIEPGKQAVRIRFRIDGGLHVIAMLDHEKFGYVMSDIAARSGVSSNVWYPQSGRLSQDFVDSTGEVSTINMRVETVPTMYGADVVVRLFTYNASLQKISNLGLSEEETKKLEAVIDHPHGMMLVVGPTGSGKSTTLYSIINELNTPDRKIVTLEDPVEYEIEGITQVPVFTDDKDSFADKLRAVMREDPDVIMVGEIRDLDTAHTALQAALTGHLVLATFHASSAAAALSRLMDMIGQNPLMASAIRLVMAQRLVRRIKPEAAEEYEPKEHVKKAVDEAISKMPKELQPDMTRFKYIRPKTGEGYELPYEGRAMILEQLVMTPAMERLVSSSDVEVTTNVLHDQAIKEGMVSMMQDGLLKAYEGVTTVEEVFRVT
jgi:type II secretory ATPase GspE/PulE/Tfp pilus assembly ATPase PilB-like protein